ncbi:hypothetical protein FFF34_009370 [Inquilinus sp. KBS0705]|nr:hypothetical protein FFF34_009370 [Inquilinus sp. KBS0705]
MYIAYSALRPQTKNGKIKNLDQNLQHRIRAYQATCQKYKQQIIEIQKYMPGWLPPFEAKG